MQIPSHTASEVVTVGQMDGDGLAYTADTAFRMVLYSVRIGSSYNIGAPYS